MCTVSVKGVLPPGGIMVSQVPPDGVVEELAVTATWVPLLVTEIVWSAGAAPFTVKVNEVGLTNSVGVGGGGGGTTAGVRTTLLEKLVLCCPPVA
jgi:hypothetical protein